MAEKSLTVHMIANAHIDPVWLWRQGSGADEVLNTCRSVCDLMDEFPELHFTKGEAWGYEQIERLSPDLFARIRNFVNEGRWEIVNGWWVQPDCNFPLSESLESQARVGGAYFREKFGQQATVGYNVDSFGHGAYLPSILRRTGVDSYVFMRPGGHEMTLPASLFSWKSPDGDSVTCLRLDGHYATHTLVELEQNVIKTVETANREVGHALCLFGLGDHGGGPSRDQVCWIRDHRALADDVGLKFSTTREFFDAVNESGASLPVVEKELHYHAIGCYSAAAALRKALRRAETLLISLEALLPADRTHVWRTLLFNHFHDIAGGCATRSALLAAERAVGAIIHELETSLENHVRQVASDAAEHHLQQIIMLNPGDRAFRGLVEIEPWLGFPWIESLDEKHLRFIDPTGAVLPSQRILQESAATLMRRFLVGVHIPPGSVTTLSVDFEPNVERDLLPSVEPLSSVELDTGTHVKLENNGFVLGWASVGRWSVCLQMLDDESDTWSHGVDRYSTDGSTAIADGPWLELESGPVRYTAGNTFRVGNSRIEVSLSTFAANKDVELRTRVYWFDRQKLLKLVLSPPKPITDRLDAVCGGALTRNMDAREYPIQGYLHLSGDETSLTVVSNDVFAADIQPSGVARLTLVRSPLYAHHLPVHPVSRPALFPVMDQGLHDYAIRLLPGPFDRESTQDTLSMMRNPLVVGESTKGMA